MRGLIFSAGLGERLRPITTKVAKPAVRFLNIPIFAYPLFWLEQLGLKDLVINTHYLPQTVERAAKEICDWDYRLHISHEPEILGSGGGIWKARDLLYGGDHFATMNGDSVCFLDSRHTVGKILDYHKKSQALATLLVCPLPGVGTTTAGVWFDSAKKVVRFGKGDDKDLNCLHFTGLIFFSDRIFSKLPAGPSNILYDVLMPEIQKGELVNVWVEDEMKWYETGRPRDYFNASNECLDLLFSSEGVRWHLVDVLDRFTPGWRNHTEAQLFASEKPTFPYSCQDGAKVLLGKNTNSSTAIHFDGHTVLGDGLSLNGRSGVEGIYLSEANMWIR
jgi:mannose-1-phosphate guanylyltransferase